MTLLLAAFTGTIVYWLIGFNPDGGRFVFFLLDLWMSFMVAESIMVLLASATPDPIIGIAAGAMIFGAFMLVQGCENPHFICENPSFIRHFHIFVCVVSCSAPLYRKRTVWCTSCGGVGGG